MLASRILSTRWVACVAGLLPTKPTTTTPSEGDDESTGAGAEGGGCGGVGDGRVRTRSGEGLEEEGLLFRSIASSTVGHRQTPGRSCRFPSQIWRQDGLS